MDLNRERLRAILDIREFVQNAGDVPRMAKMLLDDLSIAYVNVRDTTC